MTHSKESHIVVQKTTKYLQLSWIIKQQNNIICTFKRLLPEQILIPQLSHEHKIIIVIILTTKLRSGKRKIVTDTTIFGEFKSKITKSTNSASPLGIHDLWLIPSVSDCNMINLSPTTWRRNRATREPMLFLITRVCVLIKQVVVKTDSNEATTIVGAIGWGSQSPPRCRSVSPNSHFKHWNNQQQRGCAV